MPNAENIKTKSRNDLLVTVSTTVVDDTFCWLDAFNVVNKSLLLKIASFLSPIRLLLKIILALPSLCKNIFA